MQSTRSSKLLSAVGNLLSAWFFVPLTAGIYSIATEKLGALDIGFYSGFVALGVFIIGIRFASTKARENIYLVIISVSLPLYAYEAYLSIARSDGKDWTSFDQRTKLQVVMDLRKANVEAYPSIYPLNFSRELLKVGDQKVLPLGGIPSVTTVFCSETGPYLVYDSDEFGFNNPPGIWDQPIQVALVGDSYTQGSCVAADKHFSGIIRARFRGTLNLGMNGNGPIAEFAGIREYLSTLRPQYVFWFYYEGNDLIRYSLEKRRKRSNIHRDLTGKMLPLYLRPSFKQDLLGKRDAIRDAMLDWVEYRIKRQTLINKNRERRANKKAEVTFSLVSILEIASKFFTLHNIREAVTEFPVKKKILKEKLKKARELLPL